MALIACPECGREVSDRAPSCPHCGVPLGAALPAAARPAFSSLGAPTIVVRSGKSAGLAAVLSFLWCGLGQIYNGQIGKGILFGFLYLVSLVLIGVGIGVVTTPILWIWGMADAYGTAERLNREAGLA